MLVSDTVLTIKVNRALQGDPLLKDADIRVHCEDGIVTLQGSVPSERGKLQASQLSEGVFGVEEVDNRLRVDAS